MENLRKGVWRDRAITGELISPHEYSYYPEVDVRHYRSFGEKIEVHETLVRIDWGYYDSPEFVVVLLRKEYIEGTKDAKATTLEEGYRVQQLFRVSKDTIEKGYAQVDRCQYEEFTRLRMIEKEIYGQKK